MSAVMQIDIQQDINQKHLILNAADEIVAQALSVYAGWLRQPGHQTNRTRWVMYPLGYLRALKTAAEAFGRTDLATELNRREAELFKGYEALKRAHKAQSQQNVDQLKEG